MLLLPLITEIRRLLVELSGQDIATVYDFLHLFWRPMMNLRKTFPLLALAAALFAPGWLSASDHLEAPSVIDNGAADINDLYAFQNPNNPNNTILVLTANPFAGEPRPIIAPDSDPSPIFFSDSIDYNIKIDNDGDAIADVTFTSQFTAPVAGIQGFTLTQTDASGTTTIASGNTEQNLVTTSGTQVRAGLFDDPFFFDERGFFDTVNGTGSFTGNNDFLGFDVSAIVLEIPNTALGAEQVGIYTTTEENGIQIDRAGLPGIATALIVDSSRDDDFNLGDPVDDPLSFGSEIAARIGQLGGDPALVDVLLPDLLPYDVTISANFALLNGRQLADDVIDIELGLLTGGAITTDGADNDSTFLNVFPFLAPPNNPIPEPSALTLMAFAVAPMLVRRRRRF